MQELDDQRRLLQPVEQDQGASPLALSYSSPSSISSSSSSHQHKTGEENTLPKNRYQILSPFPEEHDHQNNPGYPQALIDVNLSSGCYSVLESNNKPGLEHTNCTPPVESQSVEYSQSFSSSQEKFPIFNTTVPGLPSIREREPRRYMSKARSTMSGTVKRSVSTPNVQQAAAVSSPSSGIPFSADKRRNKLGYHRTSVACGHCRRRKIRCLLAKDDPQGRCANCIRLKKDCTFLPVETTERRPRSFSKPDISSHNEAGSSTSSPSPGLGLGSLPLVDMPNSYAASVPATPTYDYATGVLDGSLRHNSVSSAASVTSGRPSISHSAATSRRPSLAHIMPGLKTETDYMNTPSFARFSNYEISPYSDNSPGHVDQVGLESAFWRLTSSPMTPNPYGGISQHMSLGSMSSLNSAEASDTQDDPIWPSRMNSIDQGMITGFSFPSTYSSDVEYNSVIPEMYHTSASASTASLTASISEVSQFGDTRLPSQVFMRQWVDTTPVSPHISEKIIRNDNFDNYYPVDDRYGQITVEESIIFPSPLQSPKFVPHVG